MPANAHRTRTMAAVVALLCSLLTAPIAGNCGSDEGNTSVHPAVSYGLPDVGDELAPQAPAAPISPAAPLANGARVLWFVPSDHDASITCLSLMNAAPAQQTVQLDGYSLAGVLSGTWSINVPAKSFVRACSDSIVSSPPPSWSALVIVNFTDFVNYVKATRLSP